MEAQVLGPKIHVRQTQIPHARALADSRLGPAKQLVRRRVADAFGQRRHPRLHPLEHRLRSRLPADRRLQAWGPGDGVDPPQHPAERGQGGRRETCPVIVVDALEHHP